MVISWLKSPSITALGSNDTSQLGPNILGAEMVAETIARDSPSSDELGDPQILTGALTRLMELEYWSRIWIIHEINLARQALLLW